MTAAPNIYWLSMNSGPNTDEKLLLLRENHYKVIHSSDKKQFQESFVISPSENNIIVISEENFTPLTSNILQQLFLDPVYDGTRMIYCFGNNEHNASEKAIECGAKDVIPLQTNDVRWLNKFRFSTGSETAKFPLVDFQVELEEKAIAEIPSRIVWINENFACINTNLSPNVGDRITVHNENLNQLDLRSFEFRVFKINAPYLNYRYANSIICEWIGRDSAADVEKVYALNRIKDVCDPLRQNIYLGIYSKKIRKKLIGKFDNEKFHVHCSSNILNLLDEIRYLQPEIILLDGRAFSTAKTLIPKIRSVAGKDVFIYIFGLKLNDELRDRMKNKYNIHCYEKIPLLIEKSINKNASLLRDNSEDIKYELPPNHPFSSVIVDAEVRVMRWHSKQIRIGSDRKIASYAMLKIKSKTIGKIFAEGVWTKVSKSKPNDDPELSSSVFVSDLLFSTPTHNQLLEISKVILNNFSKAMVSSVEGIKAATKASAKQEIDFKEKLQELRLQQKIKLDEELQPSYRGPVGMVLRAISYYNKNRYDILVLLGFIIVMGMAVYGIVEYGKNYGDKNQKFKRGIESLLNK